MTSVRAQHDNSTPRIYVACLAAYTNGKLHGRWINAAQDADDIEAEIQAMLAESPEPDAEEWAIHDYDNFYGPSVGEYESLATVAQLAAQIVEHGELFAEVYSYIGDVESAARMLEQYQGAYDSLEHWAERFMDETGGLDGIPENLRCYFDYEAFARDAELGGDIVSFRSSGEVHVCWAT